MSIYRPDRLRRRDSATAHPAGPALPPTTTKKASAKYKPSKPPVALPPSTWLGDTMTIVLAVPPVSLRPNGQHGHWRTIRAAKQAAKEIATWKTRQLLAGAPAPAATGYSLIYHFHSTPWDDDNAIASVKAYLDGISKALGIDDRHLRFRELVRRTDRKCPRLEILMHLTASLKTDP